MKTMKAVRIHAYGGPDVLTYEDTPRPIPGEGEVLIRVHATSVNPFDCAVRAGYVTGVEILLAAGLDALFHWSAGFPLAVEMAGLALIIAGYIFASAAFIENAAQGI